MGKRAIAGLVVAAVVPWCAPAGAGAAHTFSAKVTNPWFPLPQGATWRYQGVEEGKRSLDIVTVTRDVKTIMGAPCVVLRDRLYLDGRLKETTADWYTQADDGSVWYFGEDTRELDRRGRTVTREGSWRAGVNGAKPGIFMPAHPRAGRAYRQEFYRGHAEDHFRILDLHASISVPFGRYEGRAILTREWTPLEPDVVDHKYYARGIGMVAERSVKGARETSSLVSFKRG